jgi:DNA-directed RNA polymerase subunit RPC12/RpoP
MGEEWISLDELKFPEKCPYCGSRRFKVYGARKVEFEAVYEVTDEGIKTIDDQNVDCEYEVAYGLECDECGEDLSEEAGL